MKTIRRLWQAWGALRALRAARKALETVTPLKGNCGRLCGGACCQSDESGDNGMPLFPFEDKLYPKPAAGFRLLPDDTLEEGGKRLVCEGVCAREGRPLQCRLFPLRIRAERTPAGGLRAKAELDPRAWAVCPLPEMGGLRAMDQRFVRAAERAGDILLQSPLTRAALEREQRLLEETRRL